MLLVTLLLCGVAATAATATAAASGDDVPYSCESGAGKDAESTLRTWLDDALDVDTTPLDAFAGRAVPRDDAEGDCRAYEQDLVAGTSFVSVFDAIAQLRDAAPRSRVFIARNGASDGLVVPYNGRCLTTLANRGAALLLAPALDVALPKQLRAANALPVSGDEDVWAVAHGLLYIMMDQEVWVWPAFKLDFEWTLGHGRFRLQTLSETPRVIYAFQTLSADECSALIEDARPSLTASPTKDYSDDPMFKNFRTSQTAHVGERGVGADVRRRSWFLTRVPVLECVEPTQVVRYGTQKAWFKPHMDVYHNWPGFADERNGAKASPFLAWLAEFDARLGAGEFGGGVESLVYRGLLPSTSDTFQHALAQLIVDEQDTPIMSPDWIGWLSTNLANGATGLIEAHTQARPDVWPHVRKLWLAASRKHSGLAQLPFDDDAAAAASGALRKRVIPNRHVTLFQYLNDVESGGETVFPQGNKRDSDPPRPPRPDMPDCERGLAVRPKRGDSVIFYSRFGDMSVDQSAQHGGCPPIVGEKWGANAFIWNIDNRAGYRMWGSM